MRWAEHVHNDQRIARLSSYGVIRIRPTSIGLLLTDPIELSRSCNQWNRRPEPHAEDHRCPYCRDHNDSDDAEGHQDPHHSSGRTKRMLSRSPDSWSIARYSRETSEFSHHDNVRARSNDALA